MNIIDVENGHCRSQYTMEKYSMFLYRQKKCYENGYTTKIKVQSHCIAFQIVHGIFHMFRLKKIQEFIWNGERS